MLVTLLTSHCPMSWLNADVKQNIQLCADTRQREGRRADASSGRRTRQWRRVGVGSAWVVMATWRGDRSGVLR